MAYIDSNHARPSFPQKHWLGAIFLFTASFINMLDTTIVNLALPSIQSELSASNGALQWTLVVYSLAFAAGLLPFGRFGDVFGRRRLFLGGLSGFTFSSLVCGLAPSAEALVGARLFQGLTASMMMPQVLAIIHVSFPDGEKGKAIGLFGMVTALGAMAGPLIGGFIISADLFDLGWRMIFLINLPFGLIAVIGAALVLPKTSPNTTQSVDWLGAALFAAAAVALLFPIMEGRTLGWPVWVNCILLLSMFLLAGFLRHQHRLQRLGKAQLLPTSLLTNAHFLSRVGVVTLIFIGIAGPIVLLAITLQSGLKMSPAQAGIAIAAHPLSILIVSIVSSRMGANHLPLRALVGIFALLIGMSSLRFVMAAEVTFYQLWPTLAFVGAGIGTSTVALYQLVLKEVSGPDAGAGSGLLQAMQQVGIAMGIAWIGVIFFGALSDSTDSASYVAAFKHALWLPIAIYALLSIAAPLFFKLEH